MRNNMIMPKPFSPVASPCDHLNDILDFSKIEPISWEMRTFLSAWPNAWRVRSTLWPPGPPRKTGPGLVTDRQTPEAILAT